MVLFHLYSSRQLARPPPYVWQTNNFLSTTEHQLTANTNYNALYNNAAPVAANPADSTTIVSATGSSPAAGSSYRGFFTQGPTLATGTNSSLSSVYGDAISLQANNQNGTLSTYGDSANPNPVKINGTGTTGILPALAVGNNQVQPGTYQSADNTNFQTLNLYNTLGTASLNGLPPTNQVQLSYSIVGEYNNNNSNSPNSEGYGWFHAGQPATNLPTSGQAAYNGAFQGKDFTSTTTGLLNGNVGIAVDFGTGIVTGNVTNIQEQTYTQNGLQGTGPANFGIGFQGQVSGTYISGTSSFTSPTNPNSPGNNTTDTRNSGFTAGFYGPAGAEVAGALMTYGTVNNIASTVIGGVATKKSP